MVVASSPKLAGFSWALDPKVGVFALQEEPQDQDILLPP